MEKKEIERDKNVVLYEFVFDEKEVSSFEDVVTTRLNRSMTVPGFRKGKVPKAIFKMRLGEEFNGYVLDEAADKILEKMEKEKLFISPIMKDYEFKDGNLIVKIEVHEKPRVSFEDFSEIEVEKVKEDSVIEKYVEKRLEELREKHALVEPKDGEAEHGDLVRVKMKVSLGDKVLDEKEYEYILKEDDDRPFVKEIVGKKKGDVVRFSREFKDKKYDYEVEILQVYSRTLMDISDELARTVSNEFETLEQLKEHLTKEGKEIYDVEMKENLREQVLEKLPEVTNLDISDKTLDYFVERAILRMKEKGEYEKAIKEHEGDEEKLKEDLREIFLRDFKRSLAIEKISEDENIKVTEEELEKEAELLAPFWGISKERAKAIVKSKEDIREDLEWAILKRKVADFLLEKVKIVEIEPKSSEEEGDKE